MSGSACASSRLGGAPAQLRAAAQPASVGMRQGPCQAGRKHSRRSPAAASPAAARRAEPGRASAASCDDTGARGHAVALLAAALLLQDVAGLALPPAASAVLSNPNTRLPRSGEIALRRAIPLLNEQMRGVTEHLDNSSFLLRIPQRKAWGDIAADVAAVRSTLVDERAAILAAVPADAALQQEAAALCDRAVVKLDAAAAAVAQTDAEATATRLAAVQEAVAGVEVLQAPGIAFSLPAQYRGLPRLQGRATVEVVLAREGGASFDPLSDGAGPQRTARVQITLDGYNAPLTAGNFAANVARGVYDGVRLRGPEAGSSAVLVLPEAKAPRGVPLEMRAVGEFEPRYRGTLDTLGAEELPVLPLSVYGSVAATRSVDDRESDGYGWFFYLYERRTSGLGGLSFEEGQFSVFGYVTGGADVLRQLRTGDRVQSARIVSGADKLVLPAGAAATTAPADAAAAAE